MSGYIDCYYSRTLASDKFYPALTQDIEVDTCVIGAGLAGLNTALELAKKRRTVAVLEANRVGWGASGRNGGFVTPSWSLSYWDLEKKVGFDHAQALCRLLKEATDTIRARIHEYKIDCGPLFPGMLELSLRGSRDELADYSDFLYKMGLDIEYWDKSDVRSVIASERYNDAMLYKSAFHFHALNYTRGIAGAAETLGVQIYEQSPVMAVDPDAPQKIVTTDNGCKVKAKNIVFACSGYIGRLCRPLANAIVPVSSYLMCTEPLGDRMKDILRVNYCMLDGRFANDYFRPLPDTRLLWGGRVSVYEPKPETMARMLHADMLKVFPQLKDVKVEVAWGGYMGYTRHYMPQIGSTKPGVWHCTGFGAYGLCPTTAGGRVIANAITGEGDEWKLFSPFGLDFTGGPFIAPAVTQVMYWGYQIIDKINALRA